MTFFLRNKFKMCIYQKEWLRLIFRNYLVFPMQVSYHDKLTESTKSGNFVKYRVTSDVLLRQIDSVTPGIHFMNSRIHSYTLQLTLQREQVLRLIQDYIYFFHNYAIAKSFGVPNCCIYSAKPRYTYVTLYLHETLWFSILLYTQFLVIDHVIMVGTETREYNYSLISVETYCLKNCPVNYCHMIEKYCVDLLSIFANYLYRPGFSCHLTHNKSAN